MNLKRLYIAWLAAMVVCGPCVVAAQSDANPNAPINPPGMVGPSSGADQQMTPQNMNQPANSTSGTPGSMSQPSQSASMRDSLGAPGQAGQQLLDKQFVRDAVQSGLADIKLAELASQKGSPAVKDLAQKMLTDHTAHNKDLGAVADQMGVMLPKKLSKSDQAEYDKLNGMSGKDFDAEYLTYSLKEHWKNLHSSYMEASVASDSNLQETVVRGMFTLHQHLGLIDTAAQTEGITLPPRPPRPVRTTASK